MINEHDKTKEMMNTIRGGFIKKLITEVIDDTLSAEPGDAIFNSELKKLRDTVDPRVKITNFKIYPSDDNVIIEGTFLYREDSESGIHFTMSLAASELKTSMNDVEMDERATKIMKNLGGYYKNWLEEWAVKIDDYKTSN